MKPHDPQPDAVATDTLYEDGFIVTPTKRELGNTLDAIYDIHRQMVELRDVQSGESKAPINRANALALSRQLATALECLTTKALKPYPDAVEIMFPTGSHAHRASYTQRAQRVKATFNADLKSIINEHMPEGLPEFTLDVIPLTTTRGRA